MSQSYPEYRRYQEESNWSHDVTTAILPYLIINTHTDIIPRFLREGLKTHPYEALGKIKLQFTTLLT